MKNFIGCFMFSFIFIAPICHGQSSISLEPPEFLKALSHQDAQILDVRTPSEYQNGHIAHSFLADWNNPAQFKERILYLDKSKPVYVYCLSGGRSSAAAEWMRKNQFLTVYELRGGFQAWKLASMPTESVIEEKQLSLDDYRLLVGERGIVLVDFGAEWCPPCKKMEPVIEQLQKDFQPRLRIVKIDAGIQTGLMKQLSLEVIPSFLIYKNGKESWKKTGIVNLDEFKKEISVN